MTNEEAIAQLKSILETGISDDEVLLFTEDYEAIDIAIKSLEQESILDKIRAEIYRKQYDFMDDKDYDEGIRFGLMLAYQILDKYKAESEGEE
jgi:hypothetical protein